MAGVGAIAKLRSTVRGVSQPIRQGMFAEAKSRENGYSKIRVII
jgi:hypothetical protein